MKTIALTLFVMLLTANAEASVCNYAVTKATGFRCVLHVGRKVCLQQSAKTGDCTKSLSCTGPLFCSLGLVPISGPSATCAAGSVPVAGLGLKCFASPSGPTATATPIDPTPTATDTAAASPTPTATSEATNTATPTFATADVVAFARLGANGAALCRVCNTGPDGAGFDYRATTTVTGGASGVGELFVADDFISPGGQKDRSASPMLFNPPMAGFIVVSARCAAEDLAGHFVSDPTLPNSASASDNCVLVNFGIVCPSPAPLPSCPPTVTPIP